MEKQAGRAQGQYDKGSILTAYPLPNLQLTSARFFLHNLCRWWDFFSQGNAI
jgi:hypothetical protein